MKRDDLDELVRKYLACKKLSADDEVKARREYARPKEHAGMKYLHLAAMTRRGLTAAISILCAITSSPS